MRIAECPASRVGAGLKRPDSLPAAIKLALNVAAPMPRPSTLAAAAVGPAGCTADRATSTSEMNMAANPPMPCWKATMAGIWIM